MRAFGMGIGALVLATLAASAQAADPSVWLKQIYDLYHRAEKDTDLLKTSAPDLLGPHASRALAALFKRERDCVEKSHEICALDWDFIVNGQAWELSKIEVGPFKTTGDRGAVTVTFRNMKSSNANTYAFVREGGAWKLDDIESRESGRKPVSIARLLKDYKHY